jgi:hypothetical protein
METGFLSSYSLSFFPFFINLKSKNPFLSPFLDVLRAFLAIIFATSTWIIRRLTLTVHFLHILFDFCNSNDGNGLFFIWILGHFANHSHSHYFRQNYSVKLVFQPLCPLIEGDLQIIYFFVELISVNVEDLVHMGAVHANTL